MAAVHGQSVDWIRERERLRNALLIEKLKKEVLTTPFPFLCSYIYFKDCNCHLITLCNIRWKKKYDGMGGCGLYICITYFSS